MPFPQATDAEIELLKRDIYHRSGGDILPTPGGDTTLTEGHANMHAAVLRRMWAAPGDLKWDPNYGVGLRLDVNENVTSSLKNKWITRTKAQLPEDPRVRKVTDVTVTEAAVGSTTHHIRITYEDITGQKFNAVVPFPS